MEDEMTVRYAHNALEGFGNGCLLDLRVRFAMQLLTSSPRYGLVSLEDATPGHIWSPSAAARDALDVATELMTLAESRGLVEPIPASGELPDALRVQAKRTASFQVLQQMEGQKFAQREQDQVIPAAPVIHGRMNS